MYFLGIVIDYLESKQQIMYLKQQQVNIMKEKQSQTRRHKTTRTDKQIQE